VDVDGTLVDSNYQHALAWHRAFAQHGCPMPAWRTHRAIGMGADQLVPALAGETSAAEHGDAVQATESALSAVVEELRATDVVREVSSVLRVEGD